MIKRARSGHYRSMRLLAILLLLGCGSEGGEATDAAPGDDAGADAADDASDDAPIDATLAELIVEPAIAELGTVALATPSTATITVTNSHPVASAALDSIAVTGAGYTKKSTTCGAVLVGAASCQVEIELVPATLGPLDGELVVQSSGTDYTASLHGAGGWRLTVAHAGWGTATVRSTPNGIDCGSTCSALFPGDVELEAIPEAGATISWSVPSCSGLRCTVPAAAAGQTVTATIAPAFRTIRVTRAGNGQGRIVSNPAGIDCGASCTADLAGDVSLTATAEPGSQFAGWSSLVCGTSPTCVVPAGSSPVDITATFATVGSAILAVTFAGSGDGELVAIRSGTIVGRCTGSCTLVVAPGPITLGAGTWHDFVSLSVPGCEFEPRDWEGDHCTVDASGTTSVTVTFDKQARDRWTFFGDPGERFHSGVFDASGYLLASSLQRTVKLDPAGQLVWSGPPSSFPDPHTDRDGIRYVDYYEDIYDPIPSETYTVGRAHRYAPDGTQLSDFAASWSTHESPARSTELVVAPGFVGARLGWNDTFGARAKVDVFDLTGKRVGQSIAGDISADFYLRGDLAAAGDAIGYFHEPDEYKVGLEPGGYGYTIGRVGLTSWTHTRALAGYDKNYGHYPIGIAGSSDGSTALLGGYQPFRSTAGGVRPEVGVIQAFWP